MLLNLIFPTTCIGCKKGNSIICDSCKTQITLNNQYDTSYKYLLKTYYTYRPSPLLKKIIHQFKFSYKEILVHLLGADMLNLFNHYFNQEDIVLVPVPLYWKRKFQRGYNQSELLCKYISKKTNAEWCNLLIRTKNTTCQSTLNRQERMINVRNAFEINKKYLNRIKTHQTIVIIDDITTTGATIENCAKTLQKHGFIDIYGVTISKGL